MHFYFTTPKSLKITPSDEKKKKIREKSKKKKHKRVDEKRRLTFFFNLFWREPKHMGAISLRLFS